MSVASRIWTYVGHDAPVDPHVAARVNRLSKNPARQVKGEARPMQAVTMAAGEALLLPGPSRRQSVAEVR
jgi:hypothetical protein